MNPASFFKPVSIKLNVLDILMHPSKNTQTAMSLQVFFHEHEVLCPQCVMMIGVGYLRQTLPFLCLLRSMSDVQQD
jgi:hypothetical protein